MGRADRWQCWFLAVKIAGTGPIHDIHLLKQSATKIPDIGEPTTSIHPGLQIDWVAVAFGLFDSVEMGA
jgi:hypothetical protein